MASRSKTRFFAIRCENEVGITLSSKMEREAWDAIQVLVEFLDREKDNNWGCNLFMWKEKNNYLAGARETYAWRSVIDLIKDSDLAEISTRIETEGRPSKDRAELSLIKSKPIMLRIAGEVTNALIHSYNNQHKITFFQYDATEPS